MDNILNKPVDEEKGSPSALDLGVAAPPEGELLTGEEGSTYSEGLDIGDPTAVVEEPQEDFSVLAAQYDEQRKRWEMFDSLGEDAIYEAMFAQQEEFYKAASEKYNLNPMTSDELSNI